ncbi:DUF4376 domain protein [Campylobacter vicugnae]|uniref:DUF4376 domain protein n=1 Tax=Campylobacter vicugnae TaxID=1660076 RepID=A0A1X9T2R8_9BACT|nr:DUF4376 domain-containing protein [Campylobacter sp. RM8964]ARR02689.1 DUF4376 domain protein [Campylobacter sp. RM8964]
MEIKAVLKKPYTDEERIEFIVNNNHNNGYQINETDTELQALGRNDLEIAKSNKLDELSELKATKLLTLNYQGNEYQIDSDSKINISGKVSQILLAASSGQDIGAINWITKDNKVVSFSKEEFMAFGVAVAAHTESVIFKHDQLRTAVNNAASIDEIKAIAWVD